MLSWLLSCARVFPIQKKSCVVFWSVTSALCYTLGQCLTFITPSHFTVFLLRSNFLFRHENQVYTKVKFVQWTKNSKKSLKFKFLILIFDTQNVYFSFLWFARSQQFSIHLKGFENLVKKKDNFHICQGCNQGFGIKRSSINGF